MFISALPKSDLHVHLDGSVRVNTLIDLSKALKLPLPSYTEEGLNTLVFKENYKNLVEYLTGFSYVLPIMQTPESLEQIGYEFAMDNINEGVCYVEARFAPQLHINAQQDIRKVFISINNGFARAKTEYNTKPKVISGEFPEFNYGLIACAMRFFTPEFSAYYKSLFNAHPYTPLNKIYRLASEELIRACVHIRDHDNIPIVALDLAGGEAGYPPVHHKEAYHFAHQNLMNTTVHAGEAYGPESIFQAVTELSPNRIGHGTSLFSIDKINDLSIGTHNINKLAQYIAANKIAIEICLTSNLQTLPNIQTISNHPFGKMQEMGLSTVICTDNRTFSKTTVSKELTLTKQHFNLSPLDFKNLVLRGFEHSFYPGSYIEKINYIRKINALYDKLVNSFSSQGASS